MHIRHAYASLDIPPASPAKIKSPGSPCVIGDCTNTVSSLEATINQELATFLEHAVSENGRRVLNGCWFNMQQ